MRTGNSIFSGLVVLLFIGASLSVVSANTLNVSSESGAGNYTSIQAALEYARSGDRILVYPGIYTENVVVNLPNICIMSASGNSEDTIVQARNASESVFCVYAGDCKINGLTIQGSERAGIELDSSDCNVVLSNSISANPTGILLDSSNGNTIYRNSIEGNLEGITLLDSAASMVVENVINTNAFAVTLISSENNAFSRNSLEENTFGFILQESKDNIITGNTVDTSSIAAFANSSGVNMFSENIFINSTIGFLLLQSGENELTGNLLYSCLLGVLGGSGENNTFSENTITDTIYGFELVDSDNCEVIGNTVNISEISLLIDSGRDNKVSGNRFSNTLIGTLVGGTDNSSLSRNEFSNYIFGVVAIEADKSTFGNNNFSGNFFNFAPGNSLGNLIGSYSNESALFKETEFFKEDGSLKANSLLQQYEFLKVNSILKQNELLKANNILKQDRIFKQNSLKIQNQVFKRNVFSLDKSSFGQQDIFNENKSQENEQEVEPLTNGGLIGLEGLYDENLTFGMFLQDVNNSVLEGNRIFDNYCGVVLSGAQNSRLSENWLENNDFGLALDESNESLVFDNYFNNTNNTAFNADELVLLEGTGNESNNESNLTCTWNLSKTERLNIVGGPYVGGNYWALPNGTGFSQTQTDANKDGICDLPYYITEDGLNTDLLPLADAPEIPNNCADNGDGKNYSQNSSSQGDSSQNDASRYSSQSSHSGNSYQNSSPEESSGSSNKKYIPESSNNNEGADLVQKMILAGTETKIEFDNPRNDVSGISFKSEKYSGIVGIRVEAADVNKTGIIGEPDRSAYRYVKILVGNEAFESSENIAGGSIEFRVPKSWVKENGVTPGTISLYRLEDNVWKLLGTDFTGEDGAFYYLRAKTPGFSCFAITGKKQAVTVPAEQQTAIMPQEQKVENPVKSSENETAKGQAAAGDNKKTPGFGIILSGASLLLSRAYLKCR